MSRRAPDPAAERAARNANTIKSLLKLEGNKQCADCKKNKRMFTHKTHLNLGLTFIDRPKMG